MTPAPGAREAGHVKKRFDERVLITEDVHEAHDHLHRYPAATSRRAH